MYPCFLDLGIVVSGLLHAPAALPQRKVTYYPLDKRLDESQSGSGQYGNMKVLDPAGT
jgi:hypothetical protein